MNHDEELINELRSLLAEAISDRDAWKAKAEKYWEMLRLEHQHCDPDCSVCAALEEDTP